MNIFLSFMVYAQVQTYFFHPDKKREFIAEKGVVSLYQIHESLRGIKAKRLSKNINSCIILTNYNDHLLCLVQEIRVLFTLDARNLSIINKEKTKDIFISSLGTRLFESRFAHNETTIVDSEDGIILKRTGMWFYYPLRNHEHYLMIAEHSHTIEIYNTSRHLVHQWSYDEDCTMIGQPIEYEEEKISILLKSKRYGLACLLIDIKNNQSVYSPAFPLFHTIIDDTTNYYSGVIWLFFSDTLISFTKAEHTYLDEILKRNSTNSLELEALFH